MNLLECKCHRGWEQHNTSQFRFVKPAGGSRYGPEGIVAPAFIAIENQRLDNAIRMKSQQFTDRPCEHLPGKFAETVQGAVGPKLDCSTIVVGSNFVSFQAQAITPSVGEVVSDVLCGQRREKLLGKIPRRLAGTWHAFDFQDCKCSAVSGFWGHWLMMRRVH